MLDLNQTSGNKEANNMKWITLSEYSRRYRVSVSTLRRRIKNAECEYSLVEGKYLIKERPHKVLPGESQPPQRINSKGAELSGEVNGESRSPAYDTESPARGESERETREPLSAKTDFSGQLKSLNFVPPPNTNVELQAFPAPPQGPSNDLGQVSMRSEKSPLVLERAPLQQAFGEPRLSEVIDSVVSEIKKAYSAILQEKQEQILTLKEEVSDLRTLVRVLEDDSNRLRTALKEKDSIDSWLEALPEAR